MRQVQWLPKDKQIQTAGSLYADVIGCLNYRQSIDMAVDCLNN